jgi:uncharacterized oxidoreductase
VFRCLGADTEIAAEAGRHLVHANLSGHDSHGLIRLPQYVEQAAAGNLRATEHPIILKETTATALIDARFGVGLYSTKFALNWVTAKAGVYGTASAAIRHSGHVGRLGEYTEEAAERGFVTIVVAGAAGPGIGGMALLGGSKRFLGTNPWSVGIPCRPGEPIVYDGATSAIAEGKVRVARSKGVPLAAGCIIDTAGHPTNDPLDFYKGGTLLPLGGSVASHKGYCLALTAALLGGLSMIADPEPSFIGAESPLCQADTRGRVAGVFVAAFAPEFFGGVEEYRAMVMETVAAARRVSAAESVPVIMPGEIERQSRIRRAAEGIPIPHATWKDLEGIARRFDLAMPDPDTVGPYAA